MDVTPRTALRVFLLVGGLAVFGFGAMESSIQHIAIGLAAGVLGGFGLWMEHQSVDAPAEWDRDGR